MVANEGTQAQTAIRIDQVQFGQGTTVTTTAVVSGSATSIIVTTDTGDDFAIGESITVTGFGTATITGITDDTFTLSAGLTGAPTVGADVTLVNNGIVVSIRNTGTVSATIQTLYVYRNGALVAFKDGINTPIGPTSGLVPTFGLTDEATWGTPAITSGGIAISKPVTYNSAGTGLIFNLPLIAGATYDIKIVTDNGFNIEGYYSAPSTW